MNKMRKYLAMLLAVLLLASCAAPALAADMQEAEGQPEFNSLLPLTPKNSFTKELTGYLGSELKAVPMKEIFGDQIASGEVKETDSVMWSQNSHGYGDNYQVIPMTGTVDLSPYMDTNQSSTIFNAIVGKADQLASSNICYYSITLKISGSEDIFSFTSNTGKLNGQTLGIYISNRTDPATGNIIPLYHLSPSGTWEGGEANLKAVLGTKYIKAGRALTVYDGKFASAEEAEASGKDVTTAGKTARYEGPDYPYLSAVIKDNGETVHFESFQVYLEYRPTNQVYPDGLYENTNPVSTNSRWSFSGNTVTVTADTVLHKAEMTASNKYALKMEIDNPTPDYSIEKAAVGSFATLEAMKNETDIKDALFADGYETAIDKPVEITVADNKGELQTWRYEFKPVELRLSSCYLAENTSTSSYIISTSAGASGNVLFNVPSRYPLDSAQLALRGSVGARDSNGNSSEYYLTQRGKGDAYYIKKAVVGSYASESAIPAGAADIKGQLFPRTGTAYSSYVTGGYTTKINQPIAFTVVDMNDTLWNFTVSFQKMEETVSQDTYFTLTGAAGTANGSTYNYYAMNAQDDSYFNRGYQTMFILNGASPVTETTIYPTFTTGPNVVAYAGKDVDGKSEGAVRQESGQTPVTFESGKSIQYSAAAQSGNHLKNYWATFVTQAAGKQLFVNGVTNNRDHLDKDNQPLREVLLTSGYDSQHHDIFFANSGSEALTNLKITTEGLQGVKIDPYWTIQDGSTLAPLSSVSPARYQNNIGKIRLVATDEEDAPTVSGKITISADGITPVSFQVTGIAGTPKIKTTELPAGVKFIPYSTVIQTNSMGASDAIRFSLIEAESNLPAGFELRPNGELYGMPMEASEGEYYITLSAVYTSPTGEKIDLQKKTFPLTFLENTDENVWNYSDDQEDGDVDYHLTQIIPNSDGSATLDYRDLIKGNTWDEETQTIVSQGAFANFVEIYLDGRLLIEGTDYEKEEGSTKITLKTQTLRSKGLSGTVTHTVAMAFRVGKTSNTAGRLRTSNQNYTIKQTPVQPPYIPNPNPTSGPSSTSRPSATPTPRPTATPTPRPTIAPTPTPTPESVNTVSIPSTVENGTAQAALAQEQAAALISDAKDNSRDREVIKVEGPQAGSPADKYSVTLPASTANTLGQETTAALTVDTPLGGVTFFHKDLPTWGQGANTITVQIDREGDETVFRVQKDGQEPQELTFRAEVPIPTGVTASPTLVLALYDTSTKEWKTQPKSALQGERLTLPACTSGVLLKPVSNSKEFADTAGHWAQQDGAIDFMTSRDLFKGIGSNTDGKGVFNPNGTMSRAMLVSVLYRLEGTPAASAPSQLADVSQDIWYAEAAVWGQQTGIVLGTGGNSFDPDTEVSREQIAMFLYRYAQQCDMDTSGRGNVSWHPDNGKISNWASDAISWCVKTGILRGDLYGDLNPQAPATRAECTVMLTRFIYQMNGLRWN